MGTGVGISAAFGTLLALSIVSVGIIFLFGRIGVVVVVVLFSCFILSRTPWKAPPAQGLREGLKSGIGIILVSIMALLLNKLMGF